MFDEAADSNAMVPVEFRLSAALNATTAAVAGDFNDWSTTSHMMQRSPDGSMALVVELPAGRTYQYRYLVDGHRWENDWQADAYAPNNYGGDDSVIDLTESSARRANISTQAAAVEPISQAVVDEPEPALAKRSARATKAIKASK
jgi:1,4-alpha-glucan branching enzyme